MKAKELARFDAAVKALPRLGYVPRGERIDKAISGVEKFFQQKRQDVDTILQKFKPSVSMSSSSKIESTPVSTPQQPHLT